MSVIVVARLFPNPRQTADYLRIFAENAAAVHAEQGCELYAAHEAADGTILMIEKWASQADVDSHLAGEPVRVYREARQPFEAQRPQMEIVTAVPAGDPVRGAL